MVLPYTVYSLVQFVCFLERVFQPTDFNNSKVKKKKLLEKGVLGKTWTGSTFEKRALKRVFYKLKNVERVSFLPPRRPRSSDGVLS